MKKLEIKLRHFEELETIMDREREAVSSVQSGASRRLGFGGPEADRTSQARGEGRGASRLRPTGGPLMRPPAAASRGLAAKLASY